jgi:hypothetical protein
MTTLLHLNQAVLDMQENLSREQRFSQDACHNLLNGAKLLREAVEALERDIRAHFEERDRAVSRMIGTSQPYTTVIDDAALASPVPPAVESEKGTGKKDE